MHLLTYCNLILILKSFLEYFCEHHVAHLNASPKRVCDCKLVKINHLVYEPSV